MDLSNIFRANSMLLVIIAVIIIVLIYYMFTRKTDQFLTCRSCGNNYIIESPAILNPFMFPYSTDQCIPGPDGTTCSKGGADGCSGCKNNICRNCSSGTQTLLTYDKAKYEIPDFPAETYKYSISEYNIDQLGGLDNRMPVNDYKIAEKIAPPNRSGFFNLTQPDHEILTN